MTDMHAIHSLKHNKCDSSPTIPDIEPGERKRIPPIAKTNLHSTDVSDLICAKMLLFVF